MSTNEASMNPGSAGMRKYRVKYGDSPWKIAQNFTGDGMRFHELIRANLHKGVRHGNFIDLRVDEELFIPDSWPAEVVPESKVETESSNDSGAWSTSSWEEP